MPSELFESACLDISKSKKQCIFKTLDATVITSILNTDSTMNA